jgi:polyisoprenoid-binding protein YceI
MASVKSDESRRDNQFRGRMMQTASFPTATFTLAQPMQLGSIPGTGERRTVKATGELTLRGVTKTVTVDIAGVYTGSAIQVAGSIPVTFAEWDIPNPSFGPAQTEQEGLLEFAINFTRT